MNQVGGVPSKLDRNWAVFGHLGALALFVIPTLGNVLLPLVVWLVKKDELPFAAREAKESLNFQISMTIYGFAAAVAGMVVGFVGWALGIMLLAANVLLIVSAAVSASGGKGYRYPFNLRLIS